MSSAIALGIQLLGAVPRHSPLAVRKAAKALRQKVVTQQTAWKARDRMEKRVDARPIDVLADNAMSRLCGRIEAYAGLPSELYPLARPNFAGDAFSRGACFSEKRLCESMGGDAKTPGKKRTAVGRHRRCPSNGSIDRGGPGTFGIDAVRRP
jgi:hypothetical protein